MARGVWISLLLIGATLAGCLQPPAEDNVAAAALSGSEPSALAASLAAEPAPVTVLLDEGSPWWITTVASTSEGGISASWWSIPNGSFVPWSMNEEFDADDQVIALEVVPIVPAGVALDVLGFVSFVEADGALVAGGGVLRFAETRTEYGPTGAGSEELVDVDVSGEFVTLWDVADVSRIAFVALARSAEPIEVGFAWRVLDHDPTHFDSDEEAAEDLDAFRAAVNGSRPLSLPAVTASGVVFDVYFDSTDALSQTALVSTAGNVAVADATGPRSPMRSVSLSVEPALDHGWGLVDAGFFGFDVGATRWSASAKVWGEDLQGEGIAAEVGPTLFVPAPLALYGAAGLGGLGEGDGGTKGVLQIERATAPALFSSIYLGRIELGATLAELFGVPTETMSYVAGPLPVLERSAEGGEIRMLPHRAHGPGSPSAPRA